MPGDDKVHRISMFHVGLQRRCALRLLTESVLLTRRNYWIDLPYFSAGVWLKKATLMCEMASAGAQNDLERATDIVLSMVKNEYSMSEKLGPEGIPKWHEITILGYRIHWPRIERGSFKEIDSEVKKIIFNTHVRVKDILSKNKDCLQIPAKLLMEKEVVEGEELRKIIAENVPTKEGIPCLRGISSPPPHKR